MPPDLKFTIWLVLMTGFLLFVILLHKFPNKKVIYVLSYIISGIALVMYPGILSAGIMGIASIFASPDTSITPMTILILLFYAITLLQPITYVLCLIFTKIRLSHRKSAVFLSLLPFAAPVLTCSVVFLI